MGIFEHKTASPTEKGVIKEPDGGVGVYMHQVTADGYQWVSKNASIALPPGYPDLSDGDGNTIDNRYLNKNINQTYTGTTLTINQNLTVGNQTNVNNLNASGTITGNVTGDLTGNADTADLADLATNATNATTAANCTRSVSGGNGLTGGGQLTTNRTLAVGAADATIIVEANGIRVDQNNLNFTPAANNGQININASNGLTATGNNARANQSGNTTRTISGIDATTDVKGVTRLIDSVTSTSVIRAATANAAKTAYDRAAQYAPSKTGANASGTWGIDISGNAATADVAAFVSGNVATADLATNAKNIRVDHSTGNTNRPIVFVGNDDASGNYVRLYTDNQTTCFLNPNTNTIGAAKFTATGDITSSTKLIAPECKTPRISADTNIIIQPNGTTQGRSVSIFPGVDDDGVGGNIVIGVGNRTGSGGHIYFRGNGGADQFRFAKSGQTSIEGFLSFESLSTDRTFTFPNANGTIALTTSNVDTATTASNVQIDLRTTNNSNHRLAFVNSSDGASQTSARLRLCNTIKCNPSAGSITATTFSGALNGNASGSSSSCTGNAATASKVDVNASTGNADYPLLFHNLTAGTSGNSNIYYSNSTSSSGSQITMNPRQGRITATNFVGNASTATKWKTARTLWGVSVDGSANKSGAMTGVSSITVNSNMTIQPADSTTGRTLTLRGNNDTDGTGGGVVIGNSGRGAISFIQVWLTLLIDFTILVGLIVTAHLSLTVLMQTEHIPSPIKRNNCFNNKQGR